MMFVSVHLSRITRLYNIDRRTMSCLLNKKKEEFHTLVCLCRCRRRILVLRHIKRKINVYDIFFSHALEFIHACNVHFSFYFEFCSFYILSFLIYVHKKNFKYKTLILKWEKRQRKNTNWVCYFSRCFIATDVFYKSASAIFVLLCIICPHLFLYNRNVRICRKSVCVYLIKYV